MSQMSLADPMEARLASHYLMLNIIFLVQQGGE